jgi:hypothetical protein
MDSRLLGISRFSQVDAWARVFDGVFFIDTMTPVHQSSAK